jgi:hypothetical protein
MDRMAENSKISDADFQALLEKLTPQDFDGHTDFDKLTPEQRLAWLSDCAVFWHSVQGNSNLKKSHRDTEGTEGTEKK